MSANKIGAPKKRNDYKAIIIFLILLSYYRLFPITPFNVIDIIILCFIFGTFFCFFSIAIAIVGRATNIWGLNIKTEK